MVIRYGFVWSDEATRGVSEARKDRPCAVVLTVVRRDSKIMVVVAPVTHRAPSDPSRSVQIPAATKKRLGLDADASWIITDELNSFLWPGPDIRPIDRSRPAKFAYGDLPEKLADEVIAQVLANVRAGRSSRVSRDDAS